MVAIPDEFRMNSDLFSVPTANTPAGFGNPSTLVDSFGIHRLLFQ
jgi:hypothetical protein